MVSPARSSGNRSPDHRRLILGSRLLAPRSVRVDRARMRALFSRAKLAGEARSFTPVEAFLSHWDETTSIDAGL
jgi:hypothetical protein